MRRRSSTVEIKDLFPVMVIGKTGGLITLNKSRLDIPNASIRHIDGLFDGDIPRFIATNKAKSIYVIACESSVWTTTDFKTFNRGQVFSHTMAITVTGLVHFPNEDRFYLAVLEMSNGYYRQYVYRSVDGATWAVSKDVGVSVYRDKTPLDYPRVIKTSNLNYDNGYVYWIGYNDSNSGFILRYKDQYSNSWGTGINVNISSVSSIYSFMGGGRAFNTYVCYYKRNISDSITVAYSNYIPDAAAFTSSTSSGLGVNGVYTASNRVVFRGILGNANYFRFGNSNSTANTSLLGLSDTDAGFRNIISAWSPDQTANSPFYILNAISNGGNTYLHVASPASNDFSTRVSLGSTSDLYDITNIATTMTAIFEL